MDVTYRYMGVSHSLGADKERPFFIYIQMLCPTRIRETIMRNTIKFAILLLSAMISLPVFSQIQIQSEGTTKSISEMKKEARWIQWYDDGYYFKMYDYKCSKFRLYGEKYIIKIFLGKTIQEVQQSGVILQQWFDGAKNDAYINVVNPNGQKICLYKYNANIYASYGNEHDCKSTRLTFAADVAAAFGGNYATKAERDELMANIEFGDYMLTGLCSFQKEFMKSITNFKEPGQVDSEYRQNVAAEIANVKKKAREAELSDAICMQNYDLIVREIMHSEKEDDWKTIDHMNNVMLDILKKKGNIDRVALEEQLSGQDEVSGKIVVFETYYNQL